MALMNKMFHQDMRRWQEEREGRGGNKSKGKIVER
jgi:hypothetical protein